MESLRSRLWCLFAIGLALLLTSAVQADETTWTISGINLMDSMPLVNPADAGRQPGGPSTQTSEARLTPYTMPPVTVVGEGPELLHEEELIGSYAEPRWAADRRFPGVRTYVMPEGAVEFEYWTRADVPRKGSTEIQHQFELEFGLPDRFQLDFYAIARTQGPGQPTLFDQQVELRYAFADWGEIRGNPTLYLEYANLGQDAPKIEVKLLLAGELGSGWHWGQNILWEASTNAQREYEYGWTGGLSKTVIDEKFSLGAEAQFSLFDVHGHRGRYRDETFLGPSIQYRPRPTLHLDIAPLIGVDHESPAGKLFFVFGCEF